jgi:hypothetical protein
MNIIKNSISDSLIFDINQIFTDNKHLFNCKKSHKINYINLYHKDWKNNKYDNFIDKLRLESESIDNSFIDYDLHYFGFIQSYPNCDNQHFHIDYFGQSITYFIPLTELTDLNGTEYLLDIDNKISPKILLSISNKYINRYEIINALKNYNFKFKYANANKYSLIELPSNVLHRGRKNETNKNRIMFQMIFTKKGSNIDIMSDHFINDAELDDKNKDLILENRKSF